MLAIERYRKERATERCLIKHRQFSYYDSHA
jgi:hypothetical protein